MVGRVRQIIVTTDRPTQLARATVVGMAIGLIPKDSLIPYLLATVALLLVRRLFCLLAAATTGWVLALLAAPLMHKLGALILTNPRLYLPIASVYQEPLWAWCRLNNTLVTGALAVVLLTSPPVYWGSRHLYRKSLPAWDRWTRESSVYRWIMGTSTSI